MDVEGALHSMSRRSETDVCGTSAFALDPLVCWEILDNRLSEKKEKKTLICSICRFLWCKYCHRSTCQIANVMSLEAELGRCTVGSWDLLHLRAVCLNLIGCEKEQPERNMSKTSVYTAMGHVG